MLIWQVIVIAIFSKSNTKIPNKILTVHQLPTVFKKKSFSKSVWAKILVQGYSQQILIKKSLFNLKSFQNPQLQKENNLKMAQIS
jgi:hypothetical protein